MDVLQTLLILTSVGLAALIISISLPWGSLAHCKRRVSRIFITLVAAGIIAVLIWAVSFYRQGPDGGWWPVITVLYSAAWTVGLSIILGLIKLASSFRRKARPKG